MIILSLTVVLISGRNDPAAAQADTSAGIRKQIESGPNAPGLPGPIAFTIEVTCGTSGFQDTVALRDGQHASRGGLVPGETCTFREQPVPLVPAGWVTPEHCRWVASVVRAGQAVPTAPSSGRLPVKFRASMVEDPDHNEFVITNTLRCDLTAGPADEGLGEGKRGNEGGGLIAD
jgi:hypothetical protein